MCYVTTKCIPHCHFHQKNDIKIRFLTNPMIFLDFFMYLKLEVPKSDNLHQKNAKQMSTLHTQYPLVSKIGNVHMFWKTALKRLTRLLPTTS